MQVTLRLALVIIGLMSILPAQSAHAQKNGFQGFTFYHSEVQTHRLDLPPTVQTQKFELKPPFSSFCQSIAVSPENACRVEISSLVNSGIAEVSR